MRPGRGRRVGAVVPGTTVSAAPCFPAELVRRGRLPPLGRRGGGRPCPRAGHVGPVVVVPVIVVVVVVVVIAPAFSSPGSARQRGRMRERTGRLGVVARQAPLVVVLAPDATEGAGVADRHVVAASAAGVEALEGAGLAKLPDPADDAAYGVEGKRAPRALRQHGLGRQGEEGRRAARVGQVDVLARPFGAEGAAVVGVGVHALAEDAAVVVESAVGRVELAGEGIVSLMGGEGGGAQDGGGRGCGGGAAAVIGGMAPVRSPRSVIGAAPAALTLGRRGDISGGVGGGGGGRGRGNGAGVGQVPRRQDGRTKEAVVDALGVKGAGHARARREGHVETSV
ncbi:hypothetical protein CDD83_4124 [Cordyceps sp. RAO-2017]|nr:hypothetical protein CDD83_4124 [Cordyceps sp. RAO-2017]